MRRRNRGQTIAQIGTFIAVMLLIVAVSLPLWSGLLARVLPRDFEASVGNSLVSSLQQDHFCRSDAGLGALDELVRHLAEGAKVENEFRVYVVDAEIVNAFAAPGGSIVLFRPIIEKAQNPGEVAGVLAHEMAHVIERHPAKAVVQAMGYGILGLLNPGAEMVGSDAAQAIMTNHHSRNDELDADRVGVEMLNAAGHDSRGVVSFFARLEATGQEIPGALEFLSTHPTGAHRVAALEALVRDGTPVMDDDAWSALRSICEQTGSPRSTSETR